MLMLTMATHHHDPAATASSGPLALASKDFLDFAAAPPGFNLQRPARFLITDLFTAHYDSKRETVRDKPLATLSWTKRFFFTGETFDQFDLDVLLQYAAATVKARQNHVTLPHATLLKAIGRRNDVANRARVFDSLSRLQNGAITIDGNRYRYMTRLVNRVLLDEHSDACLVEVNQDMVDSIRTFHAREYALEERCALGRHGLAKWLHGVLCIFPGGFAAELKALRALTGLQEKTSAKFRAECMKALELLQDKGVITEFLVEEDAYLHATGRRTLAEAESCGYFHSAECAAKPL